MLSEGSVPGDVDVLGVFADMFGNGYGWPLHLHVKKYYFSNGS